jgi:hypothetical protein
MEAARPRSSRRRPRRGSVERPLNTRLVRVVALALIAPLLLVAFTVAQPGPLAAPALPPSFDADAATRLATELARDHAERVPGTAGADDAARWLVDKLALYGLRAERDSWTASIPDLGDTRLTNLAVVVRGATPETIVFVAHRDTAGRGPGANDNASGTAALIELARAYSASGTAAGRARPQYTLVFLFSDGGAFGGVGAARFAAQSRFKDRILAVVVLEALAGGQRPRLELAGDAPRSPAPPLVQTASARTAEQTGREPDRPGLLRQLVDLALPFGYGEQSAFLGEGISALRITTADDSGASDEADVPARLNATRLGQLGRAAQSLLDSLDGGAELAQGTAPQVALSDRFVRGWAVAVTLITAIVPFAAGVVDLVARARRHGLPLAPALRSLRSRLGAWLWAGVVLWLATVIGVLPVGVDRPLPPNGTAATDWPLAAATALGLVATAGWWVARRRLLPSRQPSAEEELAAYTVCLSALALVAVATAIVNPFALVFVLPSLYAWLWLPQVHAAGGGWPRDVLFGIGLAGPVLALVSLESRFGLGPDVFLYLAGLVSVGYLSWVSVVLLLCWAAVATQVGTLAAGRYGAYAGGLARPPGGTLRTGVRRIVVAAQTRRR